MIDKNLNTPENTAFNLEQLGDIAKGVNSVIDNDTSIPQHSLEGNPAINILAQQIMNKISEKFGLSTDTNFSSESLRSVDKDFLMSMISKKVNNKQFKKLDDGSLQVSVDYDSYGRNADGASIAALLGTPVGKQGVTNQDRQMIKMLYGSDREGALGIIESGLKLGIPVINDPATTMAFTLGGFTATIAPDGNVKVTDKYDAERFAKGSGSPAKAYRWLRNTLQNLNLFAIEGEGDQAINVDIDLGNINTKGGNS